MPRPKRTKVAPSAPAPRLKKITKSPIRAVAEAPKAPFDDLYDVSDQEHGVVGNSRRVRVSSSKRGGNAAGDSKKAEKMDQQGGNHTERETADAEPILDDIDLESSSPGVEIGRRESTLAGGESMLAIGDFRRRARQPSILGRGAGRARSSSVESNLAYDNGLMSVGRKNTSVISNFKRRPREDSIMGRNPAPSSMGLEMGRGTTPNVGSALKIGNFKHREREPSVLRTGQKERRQLHHYDNEYEDEDDFNPEDESTPLNRLRTKNMTSSSVPPSSNSRKRKLSAVQVPQSSPILPAPGEVDADDSIPATGQLSGEEEEHERETSAPVMPSIEARSETPEPMSETMAPPQSSSSTPSSPDLPARITRAPSRGRRPLRGRTPPPRTQDSPISSPPSLTHSPNRPSMANTKHKPKRQAPPPSTLSTAQLQAFLPRRRRRPAHDTFSIPSSEDEVDVSGLAPDDDELSYLDVRARSRASTAPHHRQTVVPRRKATKLKGPSKVASNVNAKRTYGRGNPMSDKENEEEVDPDDSLAPLPDDGHESPENSQELEKRVGKELKQAARKFAEVDKWELEFEDATASSSSPKDAR
ncbi:hypothetical protein EG329_009992 [Mollisiaceae sp. DMI_Dod_QoI]|nr:hypothetical protein EG329_009992 [Helotiales sp. DMI_Dod_QoI]